MTKKRIAWVLVVLLAVVGVALFIRYRRAHRPPDIQYTTQPVEHRRIVGRVTASGALQALVTVQVGSQVSGRIKYLYADFNSTVKKGELVAKLDPELFQAAVNQARANYVQAEAGVTKAEAQALAADRQYTRAKALQEQNLASVADMQTAETDLAAARANVDVAKASLEQARAGLNQAQVNLSYTSIFSPIDGVVISRSVDVGQTVAASLQAPVLFTIAEDLRKMQVNTSVAEGDVGRLAPDMAAYFTVDAFPGERFHGTIGQIRNAAQTVQNVVTYNAMINVQNQDLRLRPGMTATVTIIYDQRDNALAVPNAALRFKPPPEVMGSAMAATSRPTAATEGSATAAPRVRGGAGGPQGAQKDAAKDTRTLYVLRDGQPLQITVKTGLSDGTVTEVIEGDLHDGDRVVTDVTTSGKSAPAPAAGTAKPPGAGGSRGMRMF